MFRDGVIMNVDAKTRDIWVVSGPLYPSTTNVLLSGSWILNWIFLFILTLINSLSLSPSIYFANSPLSLLSFSYFSYNLDKQSQEEDQIPNESNYKYIVASTWCKSTTRSGHLDTLQHLDSEAPRTGPLPPP